jgi:hypothetical protein
MKAIDELIEKHSRKIDRKRRKGLLRLLKWRLRTNKIDMKRFIKHYIIAVFLFFLFSLSLLFL